MTALLEFKQKLKGLYAQYPPAAYHDSLLWIYKRRWQFYIILYHDYMHSMKYICCLC